MECGKFCCVSVCPRMRNKWKFYRNDAQSYSLFSQSSVVTSDSSDIITIYCFEDVVNVTVDGLNKREHFLTQVTSLCIENGFHGCRWCRCIMLEADHPKKSRWHLVCTDKNDWNRENGKMCCGRNIPVADQWREMLESKLSLPWMMLKIREVNFCTFQYYWLN